MCSGCENVNQTAEPLHQRESPVRTRNPLDWIHSKTPVDDFFRIVAPTLVGQSGRDEFLSETSSVSRWLQFWLDSLDSAVRRRFPEELAQVPRPTGLIWRSRLLNAFVPTMAVCGQTPAFLMPDDSHMDSADLLLGLSFTGLIFPIKRPVCVEVGPLNPEQVAEQFNRNNGSCTISVRAGALDVGADCRLAPDLTRNQRVAQRRFQTLSTSSVLAFSAGLFELPATEDEFVAIMAHELGHYYRSHPAMRTANYRFFYRLSSENPDGTPQSDPSLEKLGLAAVEASARGMNQPETRSVLQMAQSQRLGYYTWEQEADELALELLALVGIKPSVMIGSLFHLLDRQPPIGDEEFIFGSAKCRALAERNWRDANGTPVYVPVGDFSDPHHSHCYRIFNIARELRTHQYQVSADRPVSPRNWLSVRTDGRRWNLPARDEPMGDEH